MMRFFLFPGLALWFLYGFGHLAAADKPLVIHSDPVSEAVSPFVIDINLRSLPSVPAWRPGDPIKEVPRQMRLPVENGGGQQGPDPLLHRQAEVPVRDAGGFATPIINMPGSEFNGAQPPDTVGDVGVNYYIHIINGTFVQVFSKVDGSIVAGPFVLGSLGTGVCSGGDGDPFVLFDEQAQRWVISEFIRNTFNLCVYVSQTSDPVTGGWFNYQFDAPELPDYPKYATWHDAFYLTANESVPTLYALDREAMLSGSPATFQRFTLPSLGGFGFQAFTPADPDGPAPPAMAPLVLMRHVDDEIHRPTNNNPQADFLEYFEARVDWQTPGSSTVNGPFQIEVSEFDSSICGTPSPNCIPQPGTSITLDSIREVIMNRLVYRNMGDSQAIVGNFAVDVDGSDHAGIRWFELRSTGGSGSWTLAQEGTYAPDNDHRWMGAIAMDSQGNLALGFNLSSSSVFPSLHYTGRLATDPSGTLPRGEHVMVNGSGSNSSIRYGDYAAMSLDPEDGCTFWFSGMYNPNNHWETWISTFRFDGCGPSCATPEQIDQAIGSWNGTDPTILTILNLLLDQCPS